MYSNDSEPNSRVKTRASEQVDTVDVAAVGVAGETLTWLWLTGVVALEAVDDERQDEDEQCNSHGSKFALL